MKRQLQNKVTAEYIEPVIQHQLLEQTKLQKVICDFSSDLSEQDIVNRRTCAIDLLVVLCS
jgi:hypothetical protein